MMDLDEIVKMLRQVTRGTVRAGELLRRHTSFGIGGPVKFWIEPLGVEDLVSTIKFLKQNDIKWMILGKGTNILASDQGFGGAVVSTRHLDDMVVEGETIVAGAGVALRNVIDVAVENELEGAEFMSGVPGTVGGAVATNAGCGDGTMGDVVEQVDALNTGMEIETLGRDRLLSGYRQGLVPEGFAAVRVTMSLSKGDIVRIRKRISELVSWRSNKQPQNCLCAGCVFKNSGNHGAGQLIESAGLSGRQIGAAKVSEKHANFIINDGGATAADVVALMDLIEERVFSHSGIRLEREIELVGD